MDLFGKPFVKLATFHAAFLTKQDLFKSVHVPDLTFGLPTTDTLKESVDTCSWDRMYEICSYVQYLVYANSLFMPIQTAIIAPF